MALVTYNYIETQRALISLLLYEATQEDIAFPKMLATISNIIEAEDFSDPKFKSFYEILIENDWNEGFLDKAKIALLLENKGFKFLDTDEPLLYPIETLDIRSLAELLKKRSVTEKFTQLTKKTVEDITHTNSEIDLLGEYTKEIEKLTVKLAPPPEKTTTEIISEFENYALSEADLEEVVIPSPYPTLNKYTSGGFKPEQLITVGARTGVGKTVVATNCTSEACRNGKSVLFFSLEMSSPELIKRLVATEADVPLSVIKPRSDRDEETKSKLQKAFDVIKKWKIDIVDDADMTIEKIKAKAAEKAQSEDGLDMIVIDYLQLISARGGRSRQEEVAEISRSCKMMAKQLKVPVMVLVQLNRETKDDEDRLPSKADIRESAAIAADSDIILIIDRKYRSESTSPKATFILDKNRGGPADKHFQVSAVLAKNMFIDEPKEESNTQGFGKEEDVKSETSLIEASKTEDNSDDFDDLFDDI